MKIADAQSLTTGVTNGLTLKMNRAEKEIKEFNTAHDRAAKKTADAEKTVARLETEVKKIPKVPTVVETVLNPADVERVVKAEF